MAKRHQDIPHGEKTIKLSIKFFTNNLPTTNVKTAWDSGVVHVVTSRSRGLRQIGNPIPFNSIANPKKKPTLLEAVAKELKNQGITLLEELSKGETRIVNLDNIR